MAKYRSFLIVFDVCNLFLNRYKLKEICWYSKQMTIVDQFVTFQRRRLLSLV